MRLQTRRSFGAALAAAWVLAASQLACAGTIIKLSLGDTGPDVEYAGGILSTVDDGVPGTLGEQNTAIDYSDFLSFIPDVPTPVASYSLNGVASVGAATVLGTIVVQDFTGGNFQLYDPANLLLLDVTLSTSALTGPLGPTATGSLFSITNGLVVGGSLAPLILANSITMSIAMTDINAGLGLSITPLGPGFGTLNPFVADASKVIAAEVPEPASLALLATGVIGIAFWRRRTERFG